LTHRGFTLWFTGLSGAGKSTISAIIEQRLRDAGAKVEVLDGDVVRENLSKGLGFSKEDRDINIRRIGFVCELLSRNGVIALVAAISPYRAVREEIRARIPKACTSEPWRARFRSSPAFPTRMSRRSVRKSSYAPMLRRPNRAPRKSGLN
jgi:adenylyl-sulfate kinase